MQHSYGSQQALEQALAASCRTLDQWRQTLTQQFTDQTLIQRYVYQRTSKMAVPLVTEDEIRQAFEQQRASLQQRPATISFSQAVVKAVASDSADARARRRAEEILAEIRRGGNFEELARRNSADPSAAQGGMLGWFRQGQMVREFENMAYALAPGQVSPVVKTEFGYHIIKLEKVRGPERQARHILIRPEVTDADVARARARAASLAEQVRAGRMTLADAAARTSTPPDQRTLRDVLPERLPPEYGQALATAPAQQVVGPFQVSDAAGAAFAIARVNDRRAGGEYTLADVHDQLKDRLVRNKQVERLVAELKQVTAVAIAL